MVTVIGVRFRHTGKIYYFSPGALEVKKNDYVVVETARGVEYGLVVSGPKLAGEEDIVSTLRTIIRKADEKDKETFRHNLELEKEAVAICEENIRKHQLDMTVVLYPSPQDTTDGHEVAVFQVLTELVGYLESNLCLRILVTEYVVAVRPPSIVLRVLQVDALQEYELLVHILL